MITGQEGGGGGGWRGVFRDGVTCRLLPMLMEKWFPPQVPVPARMY